MHANPIEAEYNYDTNFLLKYSSDHSFWVVPNKEVVNSGPFWFYQVIKSSIQELTWTVGLGLCTQRSGRVKWVWMLVVQLHQCLATCAEFLLYSWVSCFFANMKFAWLCSPCYLQSIGTGVASWFAACNILIPLHATPVTFRMDVSGHNAMCHPAQNWRTVFQDEAEGLVFTCSPGSD